MFWGIGAKTTEVPRCGTSIEGTDFKENGFMDCLEAIQAIQINVCDLVTKMFARVRSSMICQN